MNKFKNMLTAYMQLTKPSIMLLVIFTGSTALVVQGSFLTQPVKFMLVLAGLYLTGGSANALNQYFERHIDARMKRTGARRPLPTGRIGATHALIFSVSIGVIGVILFAVFFNLLTAVLSLSTILFYSLFYTLYLKPTTPQNIVIGGIAGAMAPVGAWAAATGHMAVAPWIMFAIVFFWTPPHFWALALYCKDDYYEVELPMMPVVAGENSTWNQIIAYTVVLFVASLTLMMYGAGWFYLAASLYLGIRFIIRAVSARRSGEAMPARRLFGYSIGYLFGMFTAMMIDSVVQRLWPLIS
jgi:protoheme IX farnesyltransferase